ncbi:MAG: kelch repeat-containing protein [Persicimonas sp.]
MRKWWIAVMCSIILVGAALVLTGCGDADTRATLDISVIGWGPDEDGTVDFQSDLPEFEGADTVRVRLTHPPTDRVLAEETVEADAGGAEMPELDRGEYRRLEFDVLDADEEVIASGATPMFDFGEESSSQQFRIQVDRVESFAPVGSRITEDGESQWSQSRLDSRATEGDTWLGRVGHVTVPYDRDGKTLTVGGGWRNATSMGDPAATPVLEVVHDDLMEFDPSTGYFTDLSYDEASGEPREGGADRLEEARAYHTVTPIGDDRFLVVGGLTAGSNDEEPSAVASIELIDMGASPGERVKPFPESADSPATLDEARALHTATYRPEDGTVVVAGGIGEDGESVLDSTEIIDLDSGEVETGPSLSDARADHEAVLLDNEDETVWFIGGRNDSEALFSTAKMVADGQDTITEEADLNTERFGFTALTMGPSEDLQVLVIGGFTDLDGTVADDYEIGALNRRSFFRDSSSRLESPRARASALELPNDDVLVLGGWDDEHEQQETFEVLEHVGFGGGEVTGDNDAYQARLVEESTYNGRADFTATAMANKKILLVGGIGEFRDSQTFLDSAEYFTPTFEE